MSTPTVYSVILNVQSTLQGINGGATYHYTLKSTSVVVDPVPLETVPTTETPYLVVGDVRPIEREFQSSRPNRILDLYSITVAARVDAPGTSLARKYAAAWDLAADIETALAVDITRGGRVTDSRVQQPMVYLGLGNQSTVYLEVPIWIRHHRVYGTP